ncbi:MAG: phosphotransferase [Myxococcota bacterium]
MAGSSSERALIERVRRVTGAERAVVEEHVQELWSGYGEIVRMLLEFSSEPSRSVIVKSVAPPRSDSSRSHARKLRSYRVEAEFYARYARRCSEACRVPNAESSEFNAGTALFVLEDLDAAGFSLRHRQLGARELDACLAWLAEFHATFLGVEAEGLWKEGCYWHLATRPDELANMAPSPLRDAAGRIDEALRRARFRTLVHGDAKPDNFCFTRENRVAAVDFQYVGGGVGVKDVAYLLSCCFSGDECHVMVPRALDTYLAALRGALAGRLEHDEAERLEREWRALFPYAWADFERFLHGWAPAYANDSYVRRLVQSVLADLNSNRGKPHSAS